MKIASVAWKIRACESWSQFEEHFNHLVDLADRADLIVLPECNTLELCGLHLGISQADLVTKLGNYAERYEALVGYASKRSGAIIVAGSHFALRHKKWVHLSRVAYPNGSFVDQPKNVMTQFESQDWGLESTQGLTRQPMRELGVLVCYDIEFPSSARAWAEHGAKLLAVPAFTETRHGFQRVRLCAHARAIENQVFVVHSSLVGSLGDEPVPSTYGSSAILSPSTTPFPDSAVLAETPLNEEGVAIAKVDLGQIDLCRECGDVRNWQDRNRGDWRVR